MAAGAPRATAATADAEAFVRLGSHARRTG